MLELASSDLEFCCSRVLMTPSGFCHTAWGEVERKCVVTCSGHLFRVHFILLTRLPVSAAADVLTIENARSDDAMIRSLHNSGYSRDIGAGVYDVHSPVVPTVKFMASRVQNFVNTGILEKDARRIWVNPDCGLKTRAWKEVVPSLKNMVEAAKAMRAVVAGA